MHKSKTRRIFLQITVDLSTRRSSELTVCALTSNSLNAPICPAHNRADLSWQSCVTCHWWLNSEQAEANPVPFLVTLSTEDYGTMTALNPNSVSWPSVIVLAAVAVSQTYGISFSFTDTPICLVLLVWLTNHVPDSFCRIGPVWFYTGCISIHSPSTPARS